jgi:triacylglycerol esterase/lipase EstA (alpha/beta hydrolase family)
MRLLGHRLEREGFETRAFGYRTVRHDLATHAADLRDFIRKRTTERIDLVGHSLGGLVILQMLDEYDDLPPGRVVLLGSPVHGSGVAREVAKQPLLSPLIGEARSALDAGFSQAPEGRETGVIAGTRSIGIGRILGSMEKPNDGTVTVAECRLSGAVEHHLPVTHTGLLTAPAVARAVSAFLTNGQLTS